MSLTSLLITTCTIQQKTKTQGLSGQVVFSWGTKTANVKTRKNKNLQPKIFDEVLKVYIDDYKFYFLPSVNITTADRILIGSTAYQVLSVDTDSKGHHLEVYAQKVSL